MNDVFYLRGWLMCSSASLVCSPVVWRSIRYVDRNQPLESTEGTEASPLLFLSHSLPLHIWYRLQPNGQDDLGLAKAKQLPKVILSETIVSLRTKAMFFWGSRLTYPLVKAVQTMTVSENRSNIFISYLRTQVFISNSAFGSIIIDSVFFRYQLGGEWASKMFTIEFWESYHKIWVSFENSPTLWFCEFSIALNSDCGY